MQRLKNQFDDFKLLAVSNGFEELSLNKTDAKLTAIGSEEERSLFENKGVKADFIKLFKIKFNKENAFSIGFDFKYIGWEENERTITVSLKKGEDVYYVSQEYSIHDFKEKMNVLLAQLKEEKTLTYQTLIQTTEKQFNLSLSVPSYQSRSKNKF